MVTGNTGIWAVMERKGLIPTIWYGWKERANRRDTAAKMDVYIYSFILHLLF